MRGELIKDSGQSNSPTYNNFGRALDIISRLQARQRLTPRRVSELYSVSMRQAYRIMNEAMVCLPLTKDTVNGEAVYRWIN